MLILTLRVHLKVLAASLSQVCVVLRKTLSLFSLDCQIPSPAAGLPALCPAARWCSGIQPLHCLLLSSVHWIPLLSYDLCKVENTPG